MSFDIWLDCYRKGKPSPFKREVFEAIFLRFCSNPESYTKNPNFMQVQYRDGSQADIYMSNLNDEVLAEARKKAGGLIPPEEVDDVLERAKGDPAFIQHVGFNHCGGAALFQGMYELAHRTGSIIHWPDDDPMFVYADETVLKELSSDFEEWRKRLVRSGSDIINAIETS